MTLATVKRPCHLPQTTALIQRGLAAAEKEPKGGQVSIHDLESYL